MEAEIIPMQAPVPENQYLLHRQVQWDNAVDNSKACGKKADIKSVALVSLVQMD